MKERDVVTGGCRYILGRPYGRTGEFMSGVRED